MSGYQLSVIGFQFQNPKTYPRIMKPLNSQTHDSASRHGGVESAAKTYTDHQFLPVPPKQLRIAIPVEGQASAWPLLVYTFGRAEARPSNATS